MSKDYKYQFVIGVVILVLIVLRWSGVNETNFLNAFDIAGLTTAISVICYQIENNTKVKQKNIWFGSFLLVLLAGAVFIVLTLLEIIVLDEKTKDIITLFTLLFSLSDSFIVALFSPIRKEE